MNSIRYSGESKAAETRKKTTETGVIHRSAKDTIVRLTSNLGKINVKHYRRSTELSTEKQYIGEHASI